MDVRKPNLTKVINFDRLSDPKGLIHFFIFETNEPKNGDQEFFGIVQIHKYKTWCYFSENQLKYVRSKYPLAPQSGSEVPTSGFHFTKKNAKENRIYFNLSTLEFLIREDDYNRHPQVTYYLDAANSAFIKFKKNYPLLNLALDDKQEVFYGKKTFFSFKSAKNFSFPSFNCDFTVKMSQLGSFAEIVTYLYPEVNEKEMKVIKLFIAQNWISNKHNSYQINFFFLSFIKFILSIYSGETLLALIESKKFMKMCNNPRFERLNNAFLTENEFYHTFVHVIKTLKDNNEAHSLSILEKWDMDSSFISDMSDYLKILPKKKIYIQYHKYDKFSYLFYTCSKEVTKIKTKNFLLNNKNEEVLSSSLNVKSLGEFRFVMPKDYKTMLQWGARLHNCAGNFEQIEHYQEVVNLGVFKGKELVYLISIEEGELTQFKGFKNASPTKELFLQVADFLKSQKMIYGNELEYKRACVQS
jgi:hypothetical protein